MSSPVFGLSLVGHIVHLLVVEVGEDVEAESGTEQAAVGVVSRVHRLHVHRQVTLQQLFTTLGAVHHPAALTRLMDSLKDNEYLQGRPENVPIFIYS